ncbi:MAG: tetratricopeptide repeat protein [Fibrobacterota bacterium]
MAYCSIRYFFTVLFLTSLLAPVGADIQDDIDTYLKKGKDLIYNENFNRAEKLFSGFIEKYPEHPFGYFMKGVAIDNYMYYYSHTGREREFFLNCEAAVEKGEKLLDKDPKNELAMFFIGGAKGYMGLYEARYKRYISAFRYGWDGFVMLRDLEEINSEFYDVYLGLGLYNYWRSKLTKMMWWLPGVKDKRELGINQLKKCYKKGKYSSEMAALMLAQIYVAEERPMESVNMMQKVLAEYKGNRMFMWHLAEAYAAADKKREASGVYEKILGKISNDRKFNVSNEFRCRVNLVDLYIRMGDQKRALHHNNELKNMNIELSSKDKKRYEENFDMYENVKKHF